MCLNYSQKGTDKVRAALEAGSVTFYKYYRTNFTEPRTLLAPLQNVGVTIEDDGTIRSNRTSAPMTPQEINSASVELGIHVTASPPPAYHLDSECFTVPVTVDPADFVAAEVDGNHCVFTKIKVDRAQVERLLAEASELEDEDDDEDEDDEDDDDDACPDCGDPDCCGECMDEDDDDLDEDDEEDDDDFDDEDDDDFDDDDDDDYDDDYDDDDDEDEDDDDLDDE